MTGELSASIATQALEPRLNAMALLPSVHQFATGATPADDGVRIAGSLTVRDQTRPAVIKARVAVAGDEVTLDGVLPVNRADYGMTWNFIGIAAMHSTIEVHAVFTRQ